MKKVLLVMFVGLFGCGSPDPNEPDPGGGNAYEPGAGGGNAYEPDAGGGDGGGGGGAGAGAGAGGGGSSCDSSNCLGCCFNGACQSGNTTAACGRNGESCTSCSAGNICGLEQSCVLDQQSLWRITPVSGKFVTNGNWDVGGGAPDGKVYLYCPATATSYSLVTFEESDDFNPKYTVSSGSCMMTVADLMSIGFYILLVDVDAFSDDTVMEGTTKLKTGHFSAGSITVQRTDQRANVVLSIVRQ